MCVKHKQTYKYLFISAWKVSERINKLVLVVFPTEGNWVAGIQGKETCFSLYIHFTVEFLYHIHVLPIQKMVINFGRTISKMFFPLGKCTGNNILEKDK